VRLDALQDLVGREAHELEEAVGRPIAERRVGEDLWLIFSSSSLELRVRCNGRVGRVASWTATFAQPRSTLREAAEPFGLWPACQPDASARDVARPLLRRRVTDSAGRPVTLTATIRSGGITQLTVFDEEPDWTGTQSQ
jgi:hypothetical protein